MTAMKKTPKRRKAKPQPPATSYPATPHVIGMDWIELPVRNPTKSAGQYLSIGFSPVAPRAKTAPWRLAEP